jgi:NTP pyrophosphatase (non-canonical NTP hydrolase)
MGGENMDNPLMDSLYHGLLTHRIRTDPLQGIQADEHQPARRIPHNNNRYMDNEPFPRDMTIREAQQRVDQWIKSYGVRYFSELTNIACLTEEVGELARVMARRYGDQSFKEGEPTDPSEEMADVLWVLICLANQT